ncbi:MAG: hypothetical protein M0R37_11165 [Bacteroidales bacterium]|nr:hypothetical protein [Bacteroidales bacterium]
MLTDIMTMDELRSEAKEIQSFLDITVSEQIEEVLERGAMLSAYIARTGKMRADAEYHRDLMLESQIINMLRDEAKLQLPANTVNKLVDAAIRDYNHLCTTCERLNRTATHQLDWCRTVVSNEKSMREATKGFDATPKSMRVNTPNDIFKEEEVF